MTQVRHSLAQNDSSSTLDKPDDKSGDKCDDKSDLKSGDKSDDKADFTSDDKSDDKSNDKADDKSNDKSKYGVCGTQFSMPTTMPLISSHQYLHLVDDRA